MRRRDGKQLTPKFHYLLKRANTIRQRIKSNHQNKELVRDSSIAFIVRIFGAVSSFLLNLVIARYLGLNDSGGFFIALAFITILSTVVRIGADNAIIKFVGIYSVVNDWTRVRGVVHKLTSATIIFSVVTTILLLFSTKFIAIDIFNKEPIKGTLFWMFLSIPFYAIYSLFAMAFQGLRNVMLSVMLQNISVPILLITAVFIFSPRTSDDLAVLYLSASIITTLISYLLWKKVVPRGNSSFDNRLLWKSCLPLWVLAILQQIIQWGGQFIAGIFSDNAGLAQLAVAQRTSMLISFIGIAINLVSAPKFAYYYSSGDLVELRKYSRKTTMLMVIFSTPLIFLVWLFPSFIMSLFGQGFENGYWMLRILALGQFINVITGSVGYLLMMSGHEKDMRNITFVSGLISIVLNLVLVKHFGSVGAAVAIALSVAIQNLLAVNMVKKRLGFSTLNFFV